MKKELLCLFILAIGICTQIALQANAQTQSDIEEIIQLNLEVKNKKIVPYLEKAFYYSKTDDEAISYYEKAIKELKNIKTPEKSDIETIAVIYILIGDIKLKQNKIQAAFSCYALGYNILKDNNLKNSKFTFPCLYKTYELAKKENNERYYKDSMFLIVSTQSETAEKYPSIYSIFSEYYKSIGNDELVKYYDKKSKTKTYAAITFGNNNVLKDEKINVEDEEGAKYVEKALNTEISSKEQSKYFKEAITYYKTKFITRKKWIIMMVKYSFLLLFWLLIMKKLQ